MRAIASCHFIVVGIVLSASFGTVVAQEPRHLKIGTVGPLAPGGKGEAAEASLKDFIKTETGFTSEVIRLKSWQQLADQLADKKLQVGVFQGNEFVWAQQKSPAIKPMVLTVNGVRYPVIYLVGPKANNVLSVAELRGKAVAVPGSPGSLRTYLNQQIVNSGQSADLYFSKITTPESAEEALDDVVDNAVAAAVVDRAALDMFKRRKSARFAKLKEIQHSAPIIPPIIAYADSSLDDATRQKFTEGLLKANTTDRGQSLLSLFKLSEFEAPASDFNTVAAETLKAFPPPKSGNQQP